MPRFFFASRLFLALFAAFWLTSPAWAQQQAAPRPTLIDIEYVAPSNAAFRPIHDRLRKRQVLEQLQQFLSPLRLPRPLVVKIEQCGALSRPYKPGGHVSLCYEHVQRVEQLATKAQNPKSPPREVMMVGAFVQTMLHNVAHAIFDIYELPVWGRANDAADQLAAFIMLQFGEQVARATIIGTAWFFEASGRTWTGSDFADINSPEAQRSYNFLCIAYGSDPETFAFLVENKLLPQRRAERCGKEHFELQFAFMNLIIPHVDQDRMKIVQAMPILRPGDIQQARNRQAGNK